MKKIDIKQIKAGALIGKPEHVTVQIKLYGEDVEFDTFIKPFSYDTAVANLKAFGENKEALAGVLASCICDEDGKLEFTEEEIRAHFNQALVDALWSKVVAINILGKTSSSIQTTNSSAKSQSQPARASKKSKVSHIEKLKPGQPTQENTEVSTSADE